MPKQKDTIKGLGPRYGATLRKRYSKVIRIRKSKRKCPSCGSLSFKREAAGVWSCFKCGLKVAGESYDITV